MNIKNVPVNQKSLQYLLFSLEHLVLRVLLNIESTKVSSPIVKKPKHVIWHKILNALTRDSLPPPPHVPPFGRISWVGLVCGKNSLGKKTDFFFSGHPGRKNAYFYWNEKVRPSKVTLMICSRTL